MLNSLLDTTGLMPHGICFLWRSDIVALHVAADGIIALSYFSLPFFLVVLLRRRGDVRFGWLVYLFAAFILLCGLTHLVSIWTIWQPSYVLQGAIKAATALVSVATAIAAWPLLPALLKIPSPAKLQSVNAKLELEMRERVRAEALLEERAHALADTNKELEEFAYFASHDLKAPLRGIDNLANWLEEDIGDQIPEDSREHLRLVRARVARMERLLDDLLRYSRAGRAELEEEEVDLPALAREWFDLLNTEGRFTLELDIDLPAVKVPRAPLEQVLRNLISNAMKHHDQDSGTIRVGARANGDFIEFDVSDDGPGIAPEHRERVFDMFQTLRPRDQVEGSGMGLAIIKKILDRMGGRIHVASAGGARGASFQFRWPHALVGNGTVHGNV